MSSQHLLASLVLSITMILKFNCLIFRVSLKVHLKERGVVDRSVEAGFSILAKNVCCMVAGALDCDDNL